MRPWIMRQTWHDLLFAHWRVPAGALRPLVPASLAVDTFDGSAWVGVVPFRMSGVALRGTPALPWLSAFPELNVRTYVTPAGEPNGKPGVWFFSLDAANPVAVAVARAWFRLPYYRADMATHDDGRWVHYRSRRTHRGAAPAELAARYAPTGPVFRAAPGTLEHFLVERYCLYTAGRRGRLYRGDIRHAPWPLQPAEWEVEANTMAAAGGVILPPDPPLLHFARRVDMVAWALARV